MDRASEQSVLVDRLRSNLAAAGIPSTEMDIAEVVNRGYLSDVAAFERLADSGDAAVVPDYLAQSSPGIAKAPESSGDDRSADFSYKGLVPESLLGSSAPPFPYSHMSIVDVSELLRKREVSCEEIVAASLDTIDATDPGLNAFQLVMHREARAAALEADREIADGRYRGPLHGVPVAVKDLFALAGTPTAAGSIILKKWAPSEDAAAVSALLRAGAVIVGKTRLPEFAYSPGSNNAHYGPTRNPWNRDHDTGGSSSGSAAAVAAGMVFAALGSDTGGSIRIPASLCGVVGLKPTHGRCSLSGALTLAWSLDHVGPLTRTVADAALLLEALAGHDLEDTRTRGASHWKLDRERLERPYSALRIGVLHDDGSGRPLGTAEVLNAWQSGVQSLLESGCVVVEIDVPELEALRQLNSAILVIEALAFHTQFLRTRLLDYGSYPRHRLLHGYAYGPVAFTQSQQLRAALRRRLSTLWEHFDLLCTPTMPIAAPPLGEPAVTTFTGPFNALGWPAISMPVGLTADGLPLGLQLIGRPWDEATVLQGARMLELRGPWRQV